MDVVGIAVHKLFHALREMFQCDVCVEQVFACESDDSKQKFILGVYGNKLKHLFTDVSAFVGGVGYDLITKQKAKIPCVDMFFCGPPCKHISGEHTENAHVVGCYSDGSGCSGSMCQQGFVGAAEAGL